MGPGGMVPAGALDGLNLLHVYTDTHLHFYFLHRRPHTYLLHTYTETHPPSTSYMSTDPEPTTASCLAGQTATHISTP